jgi:hypothetical protein
MRRGLKVEGMELTMDPPMSVPIPKGEPRHAIRALSPPELPPGLNVRFHGLLVVPKMLFSVSRDCHKSQSVAMESDGPRTNKQGLRVGCLEIDDRASIA